MKKQTKSVIIFIVAVVALVLLDQISKIIVRDCFADGSRLVIWEGVFELLFVKNSGAAWGIFNQHTWILAIISLLMSVVMFICYIKLPKNKRFKPLRLTLLFVVAGAIGNGIDRFFFQYVTDFIYFKLIDFPVFNIADCYITVCMFILVFLLIFYYKDEDFENLKKKKAGIVEESLKVDSEDEVEENNTISEDTFDDSDEE